MQVLEGQGKVYLETSGKYGIGFFFKKKNWWIGEDTPRTLI